MPGIQKQNRLQESFVFPVSNTRREVPRVCGQGDHILSALRIPAWEQLEPHVVGVIYSVDWVYSLSHLEV